MTLQIQSCTIVAIVNGFPASRLSVDYLQLKKLVPGNWKTSGIPTLSPMFAAVGFENGIVIAAQNDRIQIGHQQEGLDPLASPVKQLAISLIQDNPSLVYSNVGLNFAGTSAETDVSKRLMRRFSIPETRLSEIGLEKIEGMSFSMKLEETQVFINARNVINPVIGQNAVLIDYNRDFKTAGPDSAKRAIIAIESLGATWTSYSKIADSILAR